MDAPSSATAPGIGNLDQPVDAHKKWIDREIALLDRIEARIAANQFEVPNLPATSIAVIDLASRPSVEVHELVELITTDPVLTSELLKTANSVFYAAREPIDSVQQAVVRIGIRALRSLIFSASVRGAILRDRHFSGYAHEVWRQCSSVASIARAIGPFVGFEAERAFLIALLHDIGKVPILAMIREELGKDGAISPSLIGRAFLHHHERAGAAVAAGWNLPEEIASVVGCHHRYAENVEHPRAAALAALAHKFDLLFSSYGDRREEDAGRREPELDFLGVPEEQRAALVEAAAQAFQSTSERVSV